MEDREARRQAEGHLEIAEAELKAGESAEHQAEHEIAVAIQEVEEAERDRETVVVHVIHVNEVEKASFREKLTATLRQLWDKSYSELGIPRKPKDVFQTGGNHPKSLMNYLDLTLQQAHEQRVIENYHFGIASETGGAQIGGRR